MKQIDLSEETEMSNDLAFLTHLDCHFNPDTSSTSLTDLQRMLTNWKSREGPDSCGENNKLGLYIISTPYHTMDLKN